MRIKAKFLARYRQLADTKEAELEAKTGTTVAGFKGLIKEHFPQLRNLENNLVIAVNSEFADNNQVLQEGDEVALLPPLSGG